MSTTIKMNQENYSVDYQYTTEFGEHFTCKKQTLNDCRQSKEEWLNELEDCHPGDRVYFGPFLGMIILVVDNNKCLVELEEDKINHIEKGSGVWRNKNELCKLRELT